MCWETRLGQVHVPAEKEKGVSEVEVVVVDMKAGDLNFVWC